MFAQGDFLENENCDNGDTLNYLHHVFGIASVALWMVVGFPQMYANYKNKSGDSVSELFLYTWLLGDSFNIAGLLLAYSDPPITMLLVGIWYGIMDIVLLYQIYYYRWRSRQRDTSTRPLLESNGSDIDDDEAEDEKESKTPASSVLYVLLLGVISVNALVFWGQSPLVGDDVAKPHGTFRQLLWNSDSDSSNLSNSTSSTEDSGDEDSVEELIGVIFGWISAGLYIGSRIPQIYKNYASKSTEGLSIFLFIIAVCANLSYTAGIFFCSVDHDYLMTSLPFIVGAVGTLAFDFVIFCQFYVYRPKDDFYGKIN